MLVRMEGFVFRSKKSLLCVFLEISIENKKKLEPIVIQRPQGFSFLSGPPDTNASEPGRHREASSYSLVVHMCASQPLCFSMQLS